MRRFTIVLLALLLGLPTSALAQFVWPKPEYNRSEKGLYQEDPFIIEYRRRFFAVFRGDVATFEKAFAEIEAKVKKNPKDARAIVWLGNGQTVKAGLAYAQGKIDVVDRLAEESRKNLDRAVELSPEDPNIYMMRAATLYIQGQYFTHKPLPRKVWETLRDDCLKFIDFVGPDRMKRASIHLRGEAYGSLGIAHKMLGDKQKAKEAFQKVVELNPGTAYETRAKREIILLEKMKG